MGEAKRQVITLNGSVDTELLTLANKGKSLAKGAGSSPLVEIKRVTGFSG